MAKQPAAASSYRVPRSPRDDFFDKGRPPPPTRMGGGEVTAVDDDECTVLMNDEVVEGIFIQGEPPDVGDQVEVWSSGDDTFYTPGLEVDASMVRVDHGADASVARPPAEIVIWVGSVTPDNRDEASDFIAWVNS